MENFLEAQNIVKRFSGHTALNDVSINVKPGRIFGLLGPNGAGKTTLIRIINRITMPDEGKVLFNGREMVENDIYHIGYLPEERGLYKKMKVGEQAVYLARLKGLDKRTAEKRLKEWFDKFDINPWWNKKLEELSKGMQQKIQFVITVLHKPELLIFDEPFSGFDPVNAELLKNEILNLRDEGHTIIFSTHNMNSVEEICDDIALIDHSKVVLNGNVTEIKKKFKTGLFELTIDEADQLPEIEGLKVLSTSTRGGYTTHLIQKDHSLSNSSILSQLSDKIEINSFKEQIPSMNDIFLKIVGEDNNINLKDSRNEKQ